MPAMSDIASKQAFPLLRIRELTVAYCGGRPSPPALHKVTLDLWPGEVVGILGESGSGKSTLARSTLGLLPKGTHVSGSLLFQGKDLPRQDLATVDESSWRAIRGAKIAMIFQEPGICLNPVMRVGDQIAEVMRAHSKQEVKQRKQNCKAILQEVGFSNVDRIYRAYPHQLSGGQLHRIVIAQALACRPAVVIADEPTRSLDVTSQTEILKVLKETHKRLGSALIFITHNPALLAGFADRVAIMYAGRIVEEGPVLRVLRQPFHPYTRGLLQLFPNSLGQAELGHDRRLPVIPGSLTVADQFAPGCTFEPRCSERSRVCHNEFPAEEILSDRRVSCFHHGN